MTMPSDKPGRAPVEHELKCWSEFFRYVKSGDKPFEVRKNDRDYRPDDTLWLREWCPDTEQYTGDELRFRIGYLFDLAAPMTSSPGNVVLGLLPIAPRPETQPRVKYEELLATVPIFKWFQTGMFASPSGEFVQLRDVKRVMDAAFDVGAASRSATQPSERELLDKAIMALSGQYVNDEDGDTGKECWNSAVGYCIGALRTMQEQLPVRSTTQPLMVGAVPQWPKGKLVGRMGEMAPKGDMNLLVCLQDDGDVVVECWEVRHGRGDRAQVEFCTVGAGGGRSPRTRAALIALMVAIEADNAESPDRAFPPNLPSAVQSATGRSE